MGIKEISKIHFFDHGDNPSPEDCHLCQIRTFSTHKKRPITIVNNENDEPLPDNFRFVEDSRLGDGVEPTKEEFHHGCECTNYEDCQFHGCHCLQDLEEDSSDEEEERDEEEYEDGMVTKKAYAYHSHGARAGHLRSKILQSRKPIYECHEKCACGPSCPNRVVERGRQIPLQIFRTENRGWGVRSTYNIKKGQFIDKYMGEIITAEEAERRRQQSHITQRKDVYLFALDKFSDPESLDPRLNGPPLEVDGEFMSGPTRFINHSCTPNLRIFARVGDHADKHIHELAFFAIRDILTGEELTFDYVDGVEDADNDALDPEKQKDMTQCLCGSEECRGFLW